MYGGRNQLQVHFGSHGNLLRSEKRVKGTALKIKILSQLIAVVQCPAISYLFIAFWRRP